MNSTRSLMTILGTDMTWYLLESSGNSEASIASAVMCSLTIAIVWANLAALGQYGQVGVLNTWMWTGSVIALRADFVSSDKFTEPAETSTISAISVENS